MSESSSSAPSIGPVGTIVADAYNDRSKGFLPVVARTPEELTRVLAAAASHSTFGTRLNVRLFGGHPPNGIPMLVNRNGTWDWNGPGHAPILWRGEIPIRPEAVVPVRNHPTVASILYFGANHRSRLPSDDILRREHTLLGRVMATPRKAPRKDLRVEILTDPNDQDVSDILAIYRDRYTTYLTPFTVESIRGMIAGSQVVVIRDENLRVASICVAENAHIQVPDAPPVHFVEISDAATRLDCERQGMYTSAKKALIDIIRLANPEAVITTEARANSFGVLRSNVNLGMYVAGFKIAECRISSTNNEQVKQDSIYGDLRVCCVIP